MDGTFGTSAVLYAQRYGYITITWRKVSRHSNKHICKLTVLRPMLIILSACHLFSWR
jgi:hypothetical protein